MAVELQAGTPLAESLQNALQPKLAEMGWSSEGSDDSALAEYIVLMLVSGKNQGEIATELSTDLLGLGDDDPGALAFSQWLFEQVHILQGGGAASNPNQVEQKTLPTGDMQNLNVAGATDGGSADAEMGDAEGAVADPAIPTGPKSMRDGPRPQGNKRMLGQVNRALARTPENTLHRIKGAASAGRIGKEPPKGPAPKGPRNHINQMNAIGRGMGMQQQRPMQAGPGPGAMNPMMQNNSFGTLSPQQQMQLLGLYEQQARMMAQILSPGQLPFPQNGMQSFQQQPQTPGKSLFERVNSSNGKPNQSYQKQPYQNGAQQNHIQNHNFTMSKPITGTENADPASSMEVEHDSQPSGKGDPSVTMCYFNLGCTKTDCHFVHQSPAAPPGTTVDMTDTCSFGAACKNRKCVGKHPSPAKVGAFKAQEDCKFFPNCTNPVCPFRHPTTPPCRNGADCTVEGCKYAHSTIACKFEPCLNPSCPYKHHEGQKRGNVWVGGEDGKKNVSDRKFVDDAAGPEDLVLPGQGQGEAQAVSNEIM